MARTKSVSLFEVLHPREDKSADKKDSGAVAVATPPAPVQVQAQPAREFVRIDPVAKDEDLETRLQERHYQKEVKNVSVREKNDQFVLISAVLLSFSLVTGLVGYKLGREKGFMAGAEAVIREKSSKLLGVQPVREKHVVAATSTLPKAHPTEEKTIIKTSFEKPELPYSVQPMTPVQEKIVAPPVTRKFAWLIHTFGPGQSKATGELVAELNSRGFDAFADMSRGTVYVGRLESTKGAEAQRLKNQMSGFNWRSRKLQGYFANIPDKLLK